MLGQWIDGLTDEERDRIVKEQEWNDSGDFVGPDGSRCLVAVVTDMETGDRIPMRYLSESPGADIWKQFDRLRHRFGLDRIVRACKLRAGATLSDLPQPEREAVGAG